MAYEAPPQLPLETIALAWERAEEALARLDQALAISELRDAWIARAHFAEACASVWLDGEAVTAEDLVLDDAGTAATLPTPALGKARAVLAARRALARRSPDQVLTRDGILALHRRRRREGPANPPQDAMPATSSVDDEPDRGCISRWLEVVEASYPLPALPAAALAFHAWHGIGPVRHGAAGLGRLLVPVVLRARGKTRGHDLCLAVGLKGTRPHRWVDARREAALGPWLTKVLEAIAAAAEQGLEEHRRLVLARVVLAGPLAGRRRSSHLAALADLFLRTPVVSAALAARRLSLTPQGACALIHELARAGCIRELTGRSRYRAFAIL